MQSFLWSSIQVLARLVSICSFLVPVCREWRWISWTRSHVFHHGLALSSLIFFLVLFRVSRRVFPFRGLLQVPLVLLWYCLSIQHFRYVSLVAIFYSKIVRFLLYLVVGMFLCNSLPIVDKIFFRCFGMSCFVCIVLLFIDISLVFLLWPVLSGLFSQVMLLFFPMLPVPSFFLFQSLSFS